MILVLLLMLVLGPIQVFWAFIAAAATQSAEKRRHWLLYLGGVALYFVTLVLISNHLQDATIFAPDFNLYSIWFFGGAWTLAIYHIIIAAMPVERKPRPDEFELAQHA